MTLEQAYVVLVSLALGLSCACPADRLADGAQVTGERLNDHLASAAAYSALVALQAPSRDAEARGDGAAVARIAAACLDALLLLDDDDSEPAMRRIAALSHFNLGTAPSEVYQCVVIRKGLAIVPILEEELLRPDNPCASEFGGGTSLCLSAAEAAEAIRFFVSQIETGEPCEIVP